MKICGLKLTHDASVCGIDGNELLFCVEIEKLNNNARYTKMVTNLNIERILKDFDFQPDVFVIDGWKGEVAEGLQVASYHEYDSATGYAQVGLLTPRSFGATPKFTIFGKEMPYRSYPHMAGHIIGSYCASPFAARHEKAHVISFDGGQNPRVHVVDPDWGTWHLCSLFDLYGIIYGIMGYYFGPYKKPEVWEEQDIVGKKLYGGYDKPGKLMSYIALGKSCEGLKTIIGGLYHQLEYMMKLDNGYNQNGQMEHLLMRGILCVVRDNFPELSDADVLLSLHEWLEEKLVREAVAAIPKGNNLIFTGGSALNIKWNSALRDTGHFKEVFVPPFPNDSGSAIGAACCEMWNEGITNLKWNVYCGPEFISGNLEGWESVPCSPEALAFRLAMLPEEPVLVLNGRAEVGPRALGNRSILCSPTLASNKALLNDLKKREEFRPVAPICMEEYACVFFEPGTPDPYMLFDHTVKEYWREKIPAIVHLDNTARLQTVSRQQNEVVYRILDEFRKLTRIPMLCNTSANLNGSGFFPDLRSAQAWGKVPRIWSDNILYVRK